MSEEVNESTDPLEQGSTDPFAPENQAVLNFIMQARIYDVLMALLTESNADLAKDLLELHATGALMGAAPSFNGQFITDLVNSEEEPQG